MYVEAGPAPGSFDLPGASLQNSSIAITFGTSVLHESFVWHAMPKKLRWGMQPVANGFKMPEGWAIWIDEDFAVPWYLTLVFAVVVVGLFVFAIWYTAEHGPKANGWTIGTGVLSMLAFVFPVWVLRTKDSRHTRF